MYEELIKNYTQIILEINDTSQTLVAERLKISQTKLSIALSIIKYIRKHYTLVPKDRTAKSDITSTNISSKTKPNLSSNLEGAKDA